MCLAQCSNKKDSQAALLCGEETGQERQKIDDSSTLEVEKHLGKQMKGNGRCRCLLLNSSFHYFEYVSNT